MAKNCDFQQTLFTVEQFLQRYNDGDRHSDDISPPSKLDQAPCHTPLNLWEYLFKLKNKRH